MTKFFSCWCHPLVWNSKLQVENENTNNGKFNKWKKNYLQLCTQLNFSAKVLQNFLSPVNIFPAVCSREISFFLTHKLKFGASQCASGTLLCNCEGGDSREAKQTRGRKRKEIKKLWNLSENLFSSKFNAWKLCRAEGAERSRDGKGWRSMKVQSFSKLNKSSFLINFSLLFLCFQSNSHCQPSARANAQQWTTEKSFCSMALKFIINSNAIAIKIRSHPRQQCFRRQRRLVVCVSWGRALIYSRIFLFCIRLSQNFSPLEMHLRRTVLWHLEMRCLDIGCWRICIIVWIFYSL